MYDGFNRLADKTVVIVFERSHFLVYILLQLGTL